MYHSTRTPKRFDGRIFFERYTNENIGFARIGTRKPGIEDSSRKMHTQYFEFKGETDPYGG